MEKIKLDIQMLASNGCTVTVKSITQDIVNNKSTITIHGKLTTGGSSYNYGGAYMQPTISNQPVVGSQAASQTLSKKKYSIGPNGTKEDDWTFEVYHNSDGSCSTLTIKIKWYISDSTNGTATLSGGYKPDTIPRASSVSANNGELNQSLTISIDRKNDTFTHTLKYVCGDTEGWIKDINNKVGTSATWTPPLSLANQNQSGDSVSCRIYCQTYNGSAAIGSATYKDITLTIPTMNPTASLDSATDSNSYKNTYGVFIQNKSKIHTTLSGTPQYTTINTYSWQIRKNNSSGTLLASGSTANIDYIPTESGTLYISGTVKDKRGKSGSTSTTVSIIAYSVPKCSLAVSRTNSTSASYTATGSGTVINNTNYTKNEVTYILKRGSTQVKSWNGSSLNQSGTDSILDQSYTYTLTAQDTISGVTDIKTVTISTTFTLMNFNSTGYAMAIGKASEATGTTKLLEIAMPTIISETLSVEKYVKDELVVDSIRSKNMFDYKQGIVTTGGATAQLIDKTIRVTNYSAGSYHFVVYKLFDASSMVGETFTLSLNSSKSGNNSYQVNIIMCDKDGGNRQNIIPIQNVQNINQTFTIPTISGSSKYLGLNLYATGSASANVGDYIDYTNIQVEKGSSKTTYYPFQKLDANNLAQTIQQSEFLTLNSGVSVVHYNIFKLSNTISGTIVFQTTNVIGNANVELFNIKEQYRTQTTYYTFCGLGTADWRVQRIGYFYLGKNGNGIVLDQNNSGDCKYAIINFAYQIS